MTEEEKYLARTIFKAKAILSEGQKFEDLFVDIMQKANRNFKPVKPHGNKGDRKNDGFDWVKGIYYQVYAPENPNMRVAETAKKLNKDFAGLKVYWDKKHKINEFYFVVNDKYKGLYPEVYTTLLLLRKKHKDVLVIDSFRLKDLEDIFVTLPDADILDVVGPIPSPEQIIDVVNYDLMGDVVGYLIKNYKPYSYEEIFIDPDFEEKIKFNNLSKSTAELLTIGNYQVAVVDEFFELSSNYMRNELSKIFRNLYDDALRNVPEENTKSDLMFFYILEKSCPKIAKKIFQEAIIVLMAYYFEACDIFETAYKKFK